MAEVLERPFPFVVVTVEDEHKSDLECIVTPSSLRKSCINLSSVESCVNRVISHLDILKRQIETCNKLLNNNENEEHKLVFSESLAPRSVSIVNASSSNESGELFVEGVTTGVFVNKQNPKKDKVVRVNGDEVISGALKLVARLEKDRQETLDSLIQEKTKVESLGKSFDKECERRLSLLPSAVQAEHDELFRDLIELRWHVSFDRRQLNRVKDDLRLTKLKNDKLKQSVDYYTENCPLLGEKLVIETDHMSKIAQDQQETFDKLSLAKHRLSQTEDKSVRAHKRADRERTDMSNTLDECRNTLHTLETKLKEAEAETASLCHQIKDYHAKISENRKQTQQLEDKMATTVGYLSQVEGRVSLLRQDYSTMEKEHRGLEHKLIRLNHRKQSEQGSLEAEQVLLMADMQKEDHKLREAKDSNDDLQHSVDTLMEKIALFNKQTQDDEKSVERARKELLKLDEQMGVSVAQFTNVREEHLGLSEELKTDEALVGDIEHSLRTKLDGLKQQVKSEERTKIMYDGKVQASSAELDKMKAESKQQADKAEKLAMQSQRECEKQVVIVNKLQEKEDSMTALLESLKFQLLSVQNERVTTEKELSVKISALAQQERQLLNEMQTKISRVETVTERIGVLQGKIEDAVKSTAMLDKMEGSTNAAIELLDSQLTVLREKLATERDEEQRCKEEFKQIADFSAEADKKHQLYLQKRLELLKQCKIDLFEAHSLNTALAEDYKRLQYKFISAKSLALKVVEKKLEMEESLRDQRQLIAFQSCMYTAMKAYFEHRGIQVYNDTTYFSKESKLNAQRLKLLQNQFKTVIKLMEEFLEHGLDKSVRS